MHWVVQYTDGTLFSQNREDGENLYGDIDHSRIASFALYEGERLVCRVHVPEGGRLIYRRRHTQNALAHQVFHVVGFQSTVRGVNSQVVLLVRPDGGIEAMDRFREDSALLSKFVLLPQEKWAE